MCPETMECSHMRRRRPFVLLTALRFIQKAVGPRQTLAMSLMCSLAIYACGGTTPTGSADTTPTPIVAIVLTSTNLLLATPLGEDTRRDLVYASPGQDLVLDLFLLRSRAAIGVHAVDEAGNLVSGVTPTWNSSDASVATVSSRGLVSATGIGSATITGSVGSVTSNPMTVTVSGGPFPAIVYVHSGGARGRPQFEPQATHMATKGFVGATIQFRAGFPAAVEDSKVAVRWLRANASAYRIDIDRIGAAGGSGGGAPGRHARHDRSPS